MSEGAFCQPIMDGVNLGEDVEEVIVYQRTKRKDAIDILIPAKLRLTRHEIDNIMVEAAYEEWKGTWIKSIQCGQNADERFLNWEQIARGGDLIIEDGEDGQCYTLNLESFTNGLLLYLRATEKGKPSGAVYFDGQFLRLNSNSIGYQDWDAIMQYALFGDVLYQI